MSMQATLPKAEIDTLLEVFPEGVIALDMEMTGLSPLINKIIEIGAIKLTATGVEHFSALVNPGLPIPQVTIDIHGITDEMVKDSLSIDEVLPRFLKFAEDFPLVAHNAKFDIGFLIFEMHQKKIKIPSANIYCSCKFSRFTFKNFPNHRLATLVKLLDIPLKNHHRADDDAVACLRIFAKTLQDFQKTGNLHKNILKAAYLFNSLDFSSAKNLDLPTHLQLLVDNVESQTPLQIKYRGGSYKNQWRPLRPISLLLMPQGSILYAFCLLSNAYKSFALHKITAARDTPRDTGSEPAP